MKKAVLVMMVAAMIIALFTACNKNVCPAYVKENKTEQTGNQG
jgi:hypothetical protein